MVRLTVNGPLRNQKQWGSREHQDDQCNKELPCQDVKIARDPHGGFGDSLQGVFHAGQVTPLDPDASVNYCA